MATATHRAATERRCRNCETIAARVDQAGWCERASSTSAPRPGSCTTPRSSFSNGFNVAISPSICAAP
jgi:hypothetical protein